jgi:hypothetical protein
MSEEVKVAKDGTKLGDFVLLMGKSPMYGRVVEIEKRTATGSWHYLVRRGDVKVGGEIDSILTIERVLNLDFTKPKRVSKARSYYSDDYVVIDREFIKKAFRQLNDTAAYVKMINEQEGLT